MLADGAIGLFELIKDFQLLRGEFLGKGVVPRAAGRITFGDATVCAFLGGSVNLDSSAVGFTRAGLGGRGPYLSRWQRTALGRIARRGNGWREANGGRDDHVAILNIRLRT